MLFELDIEHGWPARYTLDKLVLDNACTEKWWSVLMHEAVSSCYLRSSNIHTWSSSTRYLIGIWRATDKWLYFITVIAYRDMSNLKRSRVIVWCHRPEQHVMMSYDHTTTVNFYEQLQRINMKRHFIGTYCGYSECEAWNRAIQH